MKQIIKSISILKYKQHKKVTTSLMSLLFNYLNNFINNIHQYNRQSKQIQLIQNCNINLQINQLHIRLYKHLSLSIQKMQKSNQSTTQLTDLLYLYRKNRQLTNNNPQQNKLIDSFISKNRSYSTFPEQVSAQIIDFIQQNWGVQNSQHHNQTVSSISLKPLQLLRLLTRSVQLKSRLKQSFLAKINNHLGQATKIPPIAVQILALHIRFIQINPQFLTHQMFSQVLDILAVNNSQLIKIVLEVAKEMASRGFTKVFQEVWYVGRLLFVLQWLEPQFKPKLINLIKDLLDCKHFNQNFRRINGVTTLVNQLKKTHSNLLLKLSLLNCIYRLLLTTKTQVIYELKLLHFPSLLSLKLKEPLNFKQMILMLKILTHLMLDNDMSIRFIEEGLEDAAALLVRAHPTNCHLIKFQDIQEPQQEQAFEQFRLLLFRLLRYVSSLQKNRKIFKKIFPSELLGLFIDVGHFIKPLKAYLPVLKAYNKMQNSKVLIIEDQVEKVIQHIHKRGHQEITTIGNYNIIEQLGQGAFGCVFLAKKGSNQYALKRIRVEGKQGLESHFREVKIYKQLKHPNIVKFYESFVEQGHLYIVMQVVKGCNLSELVRNQNQKGAPFEEEAIWRLLISLISVLRYLHIDKKVIHRDLNPSNIMIDAKMNLKVADFGLAKSIVGMAHINQSFVGTLIYSCPQIVQNQSYSQKADIWSLGCIIFELMTLKPPFSGNNPLLLAKNIVSQEFSEELPQKFSQQLRGFVRLCLTKEQQKRPNVVQLLQKIVEKVMVCADQLKQKQVALSDEIMHLSKKINTGGFNMTHTRLYGMSSYGNGHIGKPGTGAGNLNHTSQDFLRQTQLVKIDSQVLNKIGQDPMSKFIDIVKKLSVINATQGGALKKNFKKFVVDTFYNRVILSEDFKGNEMKSQLHKLLNLSKQQVSFLGVKFQAKQNYIKSISYEMLYFYIEELFQLVKKN